MLLFYKGLNSHSLVIAGVIRAFSPLLTTLYALPFFKISYSVINIIGIILLLISSLVLSNEVLGKIELFYANLKKSVT